MTFNGLLSDIAETLRWLKNWCKFFFTKCTPVGIVGTAVFTGSAAILQSVMEKAMAAMRSLNSGLDQMSGARAAVDSSFLGKVNYFLPLDTLATVIMLYASIWSAVTVARALMKFGKSANDLIEKIPGQ